MPAFDIFVIVNLLVLLDIRSLQLVYAFIGFVFRLPAVQLGVQFLFQLIEICYF